MPKSVVFVENLFYGHPPYGRVFNRTENKNHYYDSIVSFLLQLTSKDAIPNDNDFAIALRERNLYRKNALCKYLLSSIENQGKEKVVTDNLSIEHIMPQNKNLSTAWQRTSLNAQLDELNARLKPFQEETQMLKDIRYLVKDLIPELEPEHEKMTPESKSWREMSVRERLAAAQKEANAERQRQQPPKKKNRNLER